MRRRGERGRAEYGDQGKRRRGKRQPGDGDLLVARSPEANGLTAQVRVRVVLHRFGDRAEGELVNTAYHRTTDGREIIIGGRYLVNYTIDLSGLVKDVWILRPEEVAMRPWPTTPDEAARWTFDPAAQVWSKP